MANRRSRSTSAARSFQESQDGDGASRAAAEELDGGAEPAGSDEQVSELRQALIDAAQDIVASLEDAERRANERQQLLSAARQLLAMLGESNGEGEPAIGPGGPFPPPAPAPWLRPPMPPPYWPPPMPGPRRPGFGPPRRDWGMPRPPGRPPRRFID